MDMFSLTIFDAIWSPILGSFLIRMYLLQSQEYILRHIPATAETCLHLLIHQNLMNFLILICTMIQLSFRQRDIIHHLIEKKLLLCLRWWTKQKRRISNYATIPSHKRNTINIWQISGISRFFSICRILLQSRSRKSGKYGWTVANTVIIRYLQSTTKSLFRFWSTCQMEYWLTWIHHWHALGIRNQLAIYQCWWKRWSQRSIMKLKNWWRANLLNQKFIFSLMKKTQIFWHVPKQSMEWSLQVVGTQLSKYINDIDWDTRVLCLHFGTFWQKFTLYFINCLKFCFFANLKICLITLTNCDFGSFYLDPKILVLGLKIKGIKIKHCH